MLTLLLLGLLSAPIQAQQVFPLPLFTEGLCTRWSSNAIDDNCLVEALNVVIDEDVNGVVVRRNGYAKYNTTSIGAYPIRGLWTFDATDGTKYFVAFSSQSFFKSSGDGLWAQIYSSTFSATLNFDCTKAIGKLWCANGENFFSWDGASTNTITSPIGNLVDHFRNRVVVAGISGQKGRVKGSGELDGTDYTLQIPGVSTTPFSIAVGGVDDGQDVTCLMGVFQDAFIIGKRDSLWGIYGYDRTNFNLREISREVGCIEDRSVQEKNNCLYWLSRRGLEKYCGASIERVSDPIRDQIDTIIATAGNPRSALDTTQANFIAGNMSVSGPGALMSATISPANVVPSSFTMVDTSSSDFASGTGVRIGTVSAATVFMLRDSSASFINAGAEIDTGTTNWQIQNFARSDTSFGQFGTYFWIGHYSYPCTSDLVNVYITDASSNTIFHNQYPVDRSGGTIEYTIETSTVSSPAIAVYITIGDEAARSVPFIPSNNLKLRIGVGSPQADAQCLVIWDLDESVPTTWTSSATYSSHVFDTSFSTPVYGQFSLDMTSGPLSGIAFEVQTASSSSGYFRKQTASNGTEITLQDRYVKFLSTFTVTSATDVPAVLYTATLPASTTGYFISQCFNPGSAITSWGTLSCNTVDYGGSLSFAVSTGPTCHSVTRSTVNWVTTTNNTVPSIPTAAYVAYRALFSLDLGTQAPTLQDCTINWQEGQSRPPVASSVYRDRYHLSYTSSTATGAVNDHQLVLNKNDKWTLFDNINCYSLSLYERKLYCGSSTSAGQVWRQDIGTDDDGSGFVSRIRTKAFNFGHPQMRKSYSRLYLDLEPSPESSSSINLTGRYVIDRGTTTTSLGVIDIGEDPGHIPVGKFPFPLSDIVSGRYIQLELESTGMNQPWRLYGGRLYYDFLRKE